MTAAARSGPPDVEGLGPAPVAVVFNVGEVLVDETRVYAVWADILGVSPLSLGAVLGAAIVQGEDLAATFAHVAPNVDAATFEDEHERRYGGFREEDLYPDVRSCLADVRALGIHVALAGNQPARRREQLLALELPHDSLATSDDLGAAKPSPRFFDGVMTLTGAGDPAQVLYVGDRIDNDVLPALDYGMRTCWLRRGPWAQLQDLPMEVDVNVVLDGLGELATLLEGWQEESAG